MAYRVEENVTWRQMWYNLQTFLTELTTVYDVSYDSATGNGVLDGLSVPDATATTETWSIICTNATQPATFSVTGTVTGVTADATVGVPYDNGIVKFTITAGVQPWVFNDIITFSTEATTSPPWTAVTLNGEPIKLIERMYYKDGSECSIIGTQIRVTDDKPKPDSTAFTTIASTARGTILGRNSWDGGQYNYSRSFTYWVKLVNPIRTSVTDDRYGESLIVYRGGANTGGPIGVNMGANFVSAAGISYWGSVAPTRHYIPSDFFATNGIDNNDWYHVTVNKTANGNIQIFLDTTLIMETNLSVYFLYFKSIGCHYPMADLRFWNKTLSVQEIQDIIDLPTATNPDGADLIDSIVYHDEDVMPYLALSNLDSSGNEIYARFVPQKAPHFAYYLSNSFRGFHGKGDLTETELLQLSNDTEIGFIGNESSATNIYLLGGEPQQVVSKYWFVATEDYIIVAYKIYDPTTSQQLPVYQIGYIGRTKTSEEMEYKAVMGTFASSTDYWYTDSASLRSGIFHAANGKFMSLSAYASPTNIYYSDATVGLYDINNSYNIYPIMFANTTNNRNFGELYNISGVQTLNVDLEDEFVIGGERYIALGDGTRAGSTSLILLKLG